MADRALRSINDNNGSSRQPVQSYESTWMAHWTQKHRDAVNQKASTNQELDYVTRVDTTDGFEASRPVFDRNIELGKAVEGKSEIQFPSLIPGIPAANEIILHGRHYLGEGTSKDPPKLMNTHLAAKDINFVSKEPLHGKFVDLSSHIVPYASDLEKDKFRKGKAVVPPIISRSSIVSKHLPNAKNRVPELKDCHEYSQLADFACKRKSDCHSHQDKSLYECFREGNASDDYSPILGRHCFPMKSYISLFPSEYIVPDKTERKQSHNDSSSPQKFQNCVRDVETMRICTTVDCVDGMPGDCCKFAQATHSLLITTNDGSQLKQNDIFRSTRVVTKFDANTYNNLHFLSAFLGQGKRRVKHKLVCNSIGSEERENIRDLKASNVTIRNESSAETDAMDMDPFKEKNLNSGAYFAASAMGFYLDINLPPRNNVASSKEIEGQWPSTTPPDINLEASSSEKPCPSSSRTQSLEMDKFLAYNEQPDAKSTDVPWADPAKRWVKRLKLSSLNSLAEGTKSSTLAENLSHAKMNEFFSPILKSSIAISGPTPRKQHDAEKVFPGRGLDLSKQDEDLMGDRKNEKDPLLSYAWIKRWLQNGSGGKKPEAVVVFEPQSSNLAQEKLPKEHFPSIAAMALMGKAITGFQPCELQKKGSFTVWNTKAFSKLTLG